MSGPIYFCNWWKCRGVKLREHTFRECPHFGVIANPSSNVHREETS